MCAHYLSNTLVPTVGRVGGQVYTSNADILIIRNGSIPVQPKTNAAVKAQQTYANASAAYATLTSSQKALWQAFSPSPTHGYKRFLACNQYMLTWGLPLVRDLPPQISIHGAVFHTQFHADGTAAWINYVMPQTSPPGLLLNLRLYWTPNTIFQTVRGGGGIGIRPVNMPTIPTRKFEYLGSWGPLPYMSSGTIDISATVYKRLGFYPRDVQVDVPVVDKSTWFFVYTRVFFDVSDPAGYVGITSHDALSTPSGVLVGFGGGVG